MRLDKYMEIQHDIFRERETSRYYDEQKMTEETLIKGVLVLSSDGDSPQETSITPKYMPKLPIPNVQV